MPTAIAVTSPDLALPATDRQTPAAVVVQAPHLQPLDDALTETSAILEHHGHLVVLYSSVCPPEHIRRLHTLRAVLESDRIAIVPLSLPPLGVALLARQLRQLSLCDFSPGVLASAARLLTHYIHAGALLGSVNGLDRVEVDLRAHMKSWLPGAHFAVLAHPQPQLLHLDRHSTEAGLPAPGFATQLAVARGQLTSEWVTGALAPAWQVQGVYEARLPAESARWWGTQKLIEFAAAIPDVSVLYQLVASVRREECGWCGLELLGDRCAFCAAPLARQRATGGGGSGQGPAAIGAPASPAVAVQAPAVHAPGAAGARASAAAPASGVAPAPGAGASPGGASSPGAVASPGVGASPGAAPVPAHAPVPVPVPAAGQGPGQAQSQGQTQSPEQARGQAQSAAPSSTPAPAPVATPTPAQVPTPAPAAPASTPAPAQPSTPAPPPPSGISGAPASSSASPPAGQPASPWGERDLAPVVPPSGVSGVPDAPGVVGVWGGRPGGCGESGQLDVRGPDLAAGGPAAPGNPYGSGRPVPGNPYATDAPHVSGQWELPGHPDFAGHPDFTGHSDVAGHPDLPGHPDVPGTPRTVARVR
ncbi:hypothetical protein [Streptomyces sp. G7(2002)]|uniref:hypothetical protein n=1 Tax=Streptomyces sp. G7(2002) TaxID=2971798 RepID=UPI00237DCA3F|nr:hypothetical protein [Streptomyces sp. G7(2002)]WDT57302.1 hypothetical protein NUT86_26470 [Streptomyces sp. G7(2002)]